MNMCLNLNMCSNSLIFHKDYFTQFLRWQFIARGRAMREKDYIVIIGRRILMWRGIHTSH